VECGPVLRQIILLELAGNSNWKFTKLLQMFEFQDYFLISVMLTLYITVFVTRGRHFGAQKSV
jgi:hypothetical protein